MWAMWRERNERVWSQKAMTVSTTCERAEEEVRMVHFRMANRNLLVPAREVEALAFGDAMMWMCDMGLTSVEFECDAKEVVDCVNRYEVDNT
ncbi:hypothetical protein LINPERPRIM_LOCUS20173 [Linum perenne]